MRSPENGYNVCPDCQDISDTIVPTIEGDAYLCSKCGLVWYWLMNGEPELKRVEQ